MVQVFHDTAKVSNVAILRSNVDFQVFNDAARASNVDIQVSNDDAQVFNADI